MRAFIKDYSLKNLKNKLIILYILNVTDIIFTLLLLFTCFYMEVNPLIAKALKDPVSGLLLKIVLPAILLILVFSRMQRATEQQLKKSNYLINGVTAFYALINAFHLVWIAILPLLSRFYQIA